MPVSPYRFPLYRTAGRAVMPLAVIVALLFALSPDHAWAQAARRGSPGPRAVALLQFDDKGQARLVPVVIMIDGEFYDAEVYKASPVPMALEEGTVYEGIRSGISQGFFTVKRAHKVSGTWMAEGAWVAAGSVKPKKPAPLAPVEEKEGPPVLRRGGPPKPDASPKPEPESEKSAPQSSGKEKPTVPDDAPKLVRAKPPEEIHSLNPGPGASTEPEDRPALKRGKPQTYEEQGTTLPDAAPPSSVLTYGAVSDATHLDVRSYLYVLRPDEEESLRQHLLDLASQEIKKQGPATRNKALPLFEDVQVRAFDVATNNEPVFVLTTKIRQLSKTPGKESWQYLTLVARRDIYAEYHTAFVRSTDTQHLDAVPRYELIDAVDAEGDGYGDLLFRAVSSAGQSFAIYRVIGNRLWPLFEGKPL